MNSVLPPTSIPRKRTSRLGIVSMVFGAINYLFLVFAFSVTGDGTIILLIVGYFFAILAVIFGAITLIRTGKNPNIKGRGYAEIGIGLGGFVLVITILLILVAVVGLLLGGHTGAVD